MNDTIITHGDPLNTENSGFEDIDARLAALLNPADFLPPEPAQTQTEEVQEEPEEKPLQTFESTEALVKVKINGEEKEIPLAEAIAGYQRQQDYTAKTQELAQEKARIQQERSQVEQYLSAVPVFAKAAQDKITESEKLLYSEEMQRLALTDQNQYNQFRTALEKEIYENKQSLVQMSAQYNEFQNYQKAQQEQVQAQFVQQRQVELQKANEVLTKELGKGWTDGTVKKELLDYGKKSGIPEEVLLGLTDPIAIIALNKARLFDESKTVSQKRVERIPNKVVTSNGNAQPPDDWSQRKKQALKSFNQGPSDVDDLLSDLMSRM